MQQIEVIQPPTPPWLVQALIFSILVHLLLLLLPQQKAAPAPAPSSEAMQMTLQQPAKPAPPPPPEPKVMTQAPVAAPKKPAYRAPAAPRKNPRASSPITRAPVASGKEIVISDLNLDLNPGQAAKPKELLTHYSDLKNQSTPTPEDGAIRSQESSGKSTRAIFGIWESQIRQKIERIGNMNFPKDEQGRPVFGMMQFRVILDENGRIADLTLLQSSGNASLDQGALQIIRRSATFGPVPVELLDQRRQIALTRYFEFADERTQWRK